MKKYMLFLFVSAFILFLFNINVGIVGAQSSLDSNTASAEALTAITRRPFDLELFKKNPTGCPSPLDLAMGGGGLQCRKVYFQNDKTNPSCDTSGKNVGSGKDGDNYANRSNDVLCHPYLPGAVQLLLEGIRGIITYAPSASGSSIVTSTPFLGAGLGYLNLGWSFNLNVGGDGWLWNGRSWDGKIYPEPVEWPKPYSFGYCNAMYDFVNGTDLYSFYFGPDNNFKYEQPVIRSRVYDSDTCQILDAVKSCGMTISNEVISSRFPVNFKLSDCGESSPSNTDTSTVPVRCAPGDMYDYQTGRSCSPASGATGSNTGSGSSGGAMTSVSVGVTGSADVPSSLGATGSSAQAAAYSAVWGEQGYRVYVSTRGTSRTPLPGEKLLYSFDSGGNTYRIYSTTP